MGNSPDARERERYQRALAAIFEVAQALLTLHSLATLEGNLRSLVVDNITALLDDLTREPHTSQQLRDRQFVDVRRTTPPAAGFDPNTAAAYRQLGEAMRQVADASRSLTAARIDTLVAESRRNLDRALISAREAFRLLAKSEDADDLALWHAIGEFEAAIDDFSHNLHNLGHARTLVERDAPRVAVEGSQRWVPINIETPDHRAFRDDRGEDPGLLER